MMNLKKQLEKLEQLEKTLKIAYRTHWQTGIICLSIEGLITIVMVLYITTDTHLWAAALHGFVAGVSLSLFIKILTDLIGARFKQKALLAYSLKIREQIQSLIVVSDRIENDLSTGFRAYQKAEDTHNNKIN